MKNSKIEWTDHTFNPVIGCEPVSEGCRNCYAAALNARFKSKGLAEWRGTGSARRAVFNGTVKRTSANYWKQPLAWNEKPWICDGCGTAHARNDASTSVCCPDCSLHRARVFCASMADWLHDAVPVEWLADLLDLIRRTPNLDWLLLTKRPENFFDRFLKAMSLHEDHPAGSDIGDWIYDWNDGNPPSNVWIGTSVEDQAAADARIPALLKIPAAVRFLSCEPLLGSVDLTPFEPFCSRGGSDIEGIHWVIVGGESGPRARPMHPDWPRGLRDQCVAAGVPFLFKQWGEWRPCSISMHTRDDHDAGRAVIIGSDGLRKEGCGIGDCVLSRVGKKAAGRMLDGREWNEFPTAKERESTRMKAGA